MKRTFKFIFAAFGIFAAFSCTKNEQIQNGSVEEELVQIQISANAEQTDVKTSISGKQVLWQEDDDIAVFTAVGTKSYKLVLNDGAGTVSGSFTGEIPVASNDLWAVYPSDAAVSLGAENILVVDFPSSQVAGEENVARGALMSVATGDVSGNMSFKNLFGLVKVTLTADNVKAIVVSGKDVAGQVKVDAFTGEIKSVVGGKNSVTLTSETGCFEPGEYYVSVLPGATAADKFRVAVVVDGSDIDGVASAKVATLAREISIARNGGFKFADTSSALKEVYAISNAEEFTTWNSSDKTMDAVLVADIDMDGASWSPRNLLGELDGQDHCVYNFVQKGTGNVALFTSTNAGSCLKNLILGSRDGVSYDGVSHVTVSQPTAVTAFTYASGLVAYINGKSTIENCKNFAKVESDGANTTKVRLGGIAGGCGNFTASILGCENAGEIVAVSGSTLSANSNIGGIVGWSDGALTIKDTKNSGYIHTDNKLINRLCGILGGTSKGVVLDNCDNSGEIKYEVANNREVYISGIIGDLNNAAAVVRNCDNTGAVSIVDKTAKSSAVVEIAGVCSKLILAGEFSNNTNAASIGNTVINTVNTENAGIIVGGVVANVAPAAGTSVTISDCKTLNASNVFDNFSFSTAVDANNTTKYIKAGGIAAQITGDVTIKNCSNAGLVQKIATDFGVAYIGGIVGFINAGSVVDVKSCTNTRWVGTTKNALGTNDITVKKGGNIFVGGICGSMKGEATFTDCVNKGGVGQTGNVDAMYGTYVYFGGIVGNAVNTLKVNGCTNSGDIKNIGKVLSWAADGNKWTNTSNGLRLGGIVGALNAGSGKTGTITGCTNTGRVANESTNAKETQELGGILGFCSGGYGVVENCVSDAVVSSLNATKANIYSGGIIGYISGNNVTANNNGVAGKLVKTGGEETVITSDNYTSCLWTLAAGKTVTTTVPNYFFNGADGLNNAGLTEENDNQNW